jgi:hypothetical protein
MRRFGVKRAGTMCFGMRKRMRFQDARARHCRHE